MKKPLLQRPWLWPFLGLVVFYRFFLSPLLHMMAPGAGCRYTPSCSAYMYEALLTHGVLRGSWLGFRRFLDCNPWGHFGIDPVPDKFPGWFTKRARWHASGKSEAPRSPLDTGCCHKAH